MLKTNNLDSVPQIFKKKKLWENSIQTPIFSDFIFSSKNMS